jgi:hypothetical protein
MGGRFSTCKDIGIVCAPFYFLQFLHYAMSCPSSYFNHHIFAPLVTNAHVTVGGARMTVSFVNTAGNNEPVELSLAGNWIDRHCTITWNGNPVAQITRDYFNARQILGDADTVCFTSC